MFARSFLIGLLVLMMSKTDAQKDEDGKQQVIENRIEQLLETLDEEIELDFTAIFDDLVYYYDHPLNLNRATEEELLQMHVLSDFQIQSLLVHIEKYGYLTSIFELQAVSGFDLNTIRFLLPFVRVNEPSELQSFTWKDLKESGNHDLFLRYQRTLEEREGYSPISDEDLAENPNRRYLGNADRYYARYRYKYRNNLSFGFTMEKDPGEEFFAGSQKNGFDFYSAHLFYQGKGLLKKVVVGDYAVNFGQGLTFHSSLAFGKSAYVMNIKKAGDGIRPYTSVDENRFMRGAGISLAKGPWELTLFYSNKNIDGNINAAVDTTDQEIISISSFQNSGFHRTVNEVFDKDAVNEQYLGTHLQFRRRSWGIGASAYQSEYDVDVQRNLSLYNQYDFNSSNNQVGGLDYFWIKNNIHLFGETSISQSGGKAFIHGALVSVNRILSVSLLHRHLERNYQNLLSNPFAETSNGNNERGLYWGSELAFNRRWNLSMYYDQFRFPWLKFRSDAPTNGYDVLTQLTHKPNRKNEFYLRFRHEEKGRNSRNEENIIDIPVPERRTYFRIHASYKISETIRLKNRLEWSRYDMDGERSNGFLMYQDLQFKKIDFPVTFVLRYALFNIDSYDARIYAYENDVLYAWSIPAYQDQGSRFYLMAKWRLARKTDLWVRYGVWNYDNRESISSGLNEIQGNRFSEIKCQLRVRF